MSSEALPADAPATKPARAEGRKLARQACDSCRLRKIKCESDAPDGAATSPVADQATSPRDPASRKRPRDENAPPCKACALVTIPCTYDMPVKRRGPPNRHAQKYSQASAHPAESIRSPDHDGSSTASGMPHTPTSPSSRRNVNGLNLAQLPSHSAMSPAEPHQTFRTPPLPSTSSGPYVPNLNISQICGRGLFQTVMQDYLDILYPLVPVVHRPTFQADLNRRREATDPVFFALVVSLMSAVISIVPRKFYEYQQSDPSFRFKTRKDMVEECHRVVLRSRDIDYHEVLTLEKWAIAYCQSLGFAHLMSMNRFKIANGEAVMILWTLKCHLASSYDGLDFIEAQLRKKAFWLEFSAMAHFRLEDPSWISLYDRFAFDSATAEHLFPYEVDDEYITATTIGPQPSNKLALTVGLNILSRVFCGILPIVRDVSLPLATANNADDDQKDMIGTCECGNIIRPTSQKVVLYSLLQKQKSVMEDLPNEFTQWHKPSTADMARIPGVHGTVEASHYESMKANIHVTHLWIQSTLFERLVAVSKMEGQSVNEEVDMSGVWTLRESICRQLLSILYNISQTNLEPNGTSLPYKIRQVAYTLLECPDTEQDSTSKRARAYIHNFCELLAKLDGNYEEEAKAWVELEKQRRTSPSAFLDMSE